MKKFGIILLSIAFLLSAFTLLPVKKAVCHTEDRPMLMAAWPWHEGDWNKVAPPPPPWNVTPANSPTDSPSTGERPGPQKVQQKTQKSLWSRLQFFLFNLKLLLGGK